MKSLDSRALIHIESGTVWFTQPSVLIHVFPNFANLPPNSFRWWKNKMAVDRYLLSISMEITQQRYKVLSTLTKNTLKHLLPCSGFFLNRSSDGLLLTTPPVFSLSLGEGIIMPSWSSLHMLDWLDVLETALCNAWSDEARAEDTLRGELAGDCCVACRKPEWGWIETMGKIVRVFTALTIDVL